MNKWDKYNKLRCSGCFTCRGCIGWIPIEEGLPPINEYILLSFENFPLPSIGIYHEKDEGGWAFFDEGDDDLNWIGAVVNAWMPLPERYDGKER